MNRSDPEVYGLTLRAKYKQMDLLIAQLRATSQTAQAGMTK